MYVSFLTCLISSLRLTPRNRIAGSQNMKLFRETCYDINKAHWSYAMSGGQYQQETA